MQVIVTILRNTGYIGENKVPQRDLSTTREVCFYKLDSVPTARVKFNTCGPKCEMGREGWGLWVGSGVGGWVGAAGIKPPASPAAPSPTAAGNVAPKPQTRLKNPPDPKPNPLNPVAMEVTDISPVPVEVFPGTNKMLFTPVYHIKVRRPACSS
jgi:hypothetical protein